MGLQFTYHKDAKNIIWLLSKLRQPRSLRLCVFVALKQLLSLIKKTSTSLVKTHTICGKTYYLNP
jgi:hypothetical protein